MIDKYNSLLKFGNKKFFNKQDSEDFRSYAITKLIEGRKATFEQLYFDYLRMEHGDDRKDWHYKKHFISIDTLQQAEESDCEMISLISDIMNKLTGRDACIFMLYYYWGFSLHEIGYCFKLSKSAISKIIKSIIEKL